MPGLETLITIGTTALTGLVTEMFKRYGGRILERADINFTEERELKAAAESYVQSYARRHGILKVLGMREPTFLDDIYTAARFLDNQEIRSFESITGIETIYRQRNQRGFGDREAATLPGIEIANQKQLLMVLGGPRAGKSTFLRKVGLEALKGLKGEYTHRCIPVLLELKMFRGKELDIKRAIAREFEICGFLVAEKFTEEALKEGRLLVLLDGLDEVPTEERNKAIIEIQNFAQEYGKNRFIASCRVAAYRYNFRQFTDIAIADFSDGQIEEFIRNWFRSQPEWRERCWEQINSKNYAATKELACTPLLLTLVCLLFQRSGQLPTNRATLYERALRVLLEEWDAEKVVPREAVYQGLDTRRKELLLAEIAWDGFERDELFFQGRAIAEKMEGLLRDMLPDEPYVDGAKVLKSIEVQHGVLVERSEGIYSFSHLTLQEFLTAQLVAFSPRQVEAIVETHLTDERWREVFILMAGLQTSADDLLLCMEGRAQKYLDTKRLRSLVHWSNEATKDSKGRDKNAAKRVGAICLILDLTRDLALARDLDPEFAHDLTFTLDIALDLAHELGLTFELKRDLDLTFDLDRSLALSLALALDIAFELDVERAGIFESLDLLAFRNYERLQEDLKKNQINMSTKPYEDYKISSIKIWQNKINFDLDFLEFSRLELQSLEDFLETHRRMIQCQKSAVRVSRGLWEEIEGRMVTVQS